MRAYIRVYENEWIDRYNIFNITHDNNTPYEYIRIPTARSHNRWPTKKKIL